MKTSDFLVIGAGVAGLSFALRAAEHGKVAVITKGKFLDCSSAKAQGGIAAVWDRNDSFEDHVADTLDAGAGLCNEQAVRTIVEEGPDAIRELLEWGVNFDPGNQGEDYELAREGGHTKRRILHAKDATGLEITSKLLEAAKLHPNIELLEDHFAIDLITTTKLGLVTEDRVLGAYVLDRVSGEVEIFRSDRVLLATGGCGRVYLYTTNNDSATGDGVAMAWRAGATIANMEFVQFHPTCFFNTRAEGAEARSFLISEAVRGEGGVLIGADGKEFMHKYDPRKSLAPRDITARAVDSEMKRTGSMCVYLDISHKPEGFVQERFPLIYETCNRYGVNPAREPIPVVPAAHFQCGGVLTDVNGQTSLDGLYAAGETGCTAGVDTAAAAGCCITVKLPLFIWSSSFVSRAFNAFASRLNSGCAISKIHSSASIRRLALLEKSATVCCTSPIMRTSSPLDSCLERVCTSWSEATPESMVIPASGAVFSTSKSRIRQASSSSMAPKSLPSV